MIINYIEEGIYLLVKKISALLLSVIVFLAITPALHTSAALTDGTYSVSYSVIKPDSGSASMADGYFAKPAKVKVEGGKITVQLTTTSNMIKDFQVDSKNVSVLSTSGENETVQFTVNSISQPVNAKIHVVADASYDHWYSIRLSFDEANAKLIEAATNNQETAPASSGGEEDNNTSGQNQEQEVVANPETGDNVQLYVLLAIGAALFILFTYQKQMKRG